MRSADRLGQLRKLARVQTVLTEDAAAALADARDAERAAEAALDRDLQSVEQAARQWYAQLGGTLDPERATASAALLLDRERDADASKVDHDKATALRAGREEAWHAAHAAERATGKVVDALHRHRARKAEERALAAASDRVTSDWMSK